MSKMNNLIGFWNNKSSEESDTSLPQHTRKVRPKSENLDHNFSQRMEFFASPKNLRGEETRVRLSSEERSGSGSSGSGSGPHIKGSVKWSHRPRDCDSDSDQSRPAISLVVTDVDRDMNAGRPGEEGGSAQGKGYPKFQSPPVSPLVKTGPSLPSTPTSPTSPSSPGWSSLSPGTSATKNQSPFAKFRQLEDNVLSSSLPGQGSRTPPLTSKGSVSLHRNLSMPASTPRPTLTVKMMDQQQGQSRPGGAMAARSGSGAKEMILMWVQNRIRDYPIPMTNFSTCWNNGLAFCALIHVFYPDNFDWYSLKAENRRHNFTLAFQKAEELAGIYPLLEVDDMVRFQKPDWKCVFTYVQSFYRRFRDGRSPPPRSAAAPGTPETPGGGPVKLSEVALAVAECQAAEQRGKQIADQVLAAKPRPSPGASKDAEKIEKQRSVEEADKAEDATEIKKESRAETVPESMEDITEAKTVESDIKVEGKATTEEENQSEELRLQPTQVAEVKDDSADKSPEADAVHTQVATITLKPSPSKLGPTVRGNSGKFSRSKSVNTEHPGVEEVSKERKFSFNHPMPTASPPALQL